MVSLSQGKQDKFKQFYIKKVFILTQIFTRLLQRCFHQQSFNSQQILYHTLTTTLNLYMKRIILILVQH